MRPVIRSIRRLRSVDAVLRRLRASTCAGLCAGLALAPIACGGEPAPPASTDAPSSAPGAATGVAVDGTPKVVFKGDPALASLETIPTQDEFDAQIAATIDAENADAIFEALRAELEADPTAR